MIGTITELVDNCNYYRINLLYKLYIYITSLTRAKPKEKMEFPA